MEAFCAAHRGAVMSQTVSIIVGVACLLWRLRLPPRPWWWWRWRWPRRPPWWWPAAGHLGLGLLFTYTCHKKKINPHVDWLVTWASQKAMQISWWYLPWHDEEFEDMITSIRKTVAVRQMALLVLHLTRAMRWQRQLMYLHPFHFISMQGFI